MSKINFEEDQEIVDISFVGQKLRLEVSENYINSELIEIEYNRNELVSNHLVDIYGNRIEDFIFGEKKSKRNGGATLMPPIYTTTEINDLKAIEGMIIFNTTTKKHQGFDGVFWNDFY